MSELRRLAEQQEQLERAKQTYRGALVKRYFMRFHMSLLLAATVGAGVGASRLLLAAGMHDPLWRYPLATLLGYAVFVGLVRLWAVYVTGLLPGAPQISGNLPDLGSVDVSLPSGAPDAGVSFAGGDAGGAGASDAWGAADLVPDVDMPDVSVDGDDGLIVLVVLAVLVVVLCGAGVYLIWIAPQLLSEVAFEVMLAGGMFRSLRRMDAGGWMGGVIGRTVIPFLLVLAAAAVLGWALHHYVPGATRIGDVFRD